MGGVEELSSPCSSQGRRAPACPLLTSLPRGEGSSPHREADPVLWQRPESQSRDPRLSPVAGDQPPCSSAQGRESLLTDRASRGGWLTRWVCRAPRGSLQVLTGTETVDEMTHPPTFTTIHTAISPRSHPPTHPSIRPATPTAHQLTHPPAPQPSICLFKIHSAPRTGPPGH